MLGGVWLAFKLSERVVKVTLYFLVVSYISSSHALQIRNNFAILLDFFSDFITLSFNFMECAFESTDQIPHLIDIILLAD